MAINNEFTIELAGRRVRISTLHDSVRQMCENYIEGVDFDGGVDTELLSDQSVALATGRNADCPDEQADFSVTITQSDIDKERGIRAEQEEREGRAATGCDDAYLETLAVYRKIAVGMLDYDTLLMHGSAIEVNGEAVIFTGSSGTGKSTHAKLWIDNIPGVRYINDDKPLVSLGRGGGAFGPADQSPPLGTAAAEPHLGALGTADAEPRAYAHGTPWDGKHHRSNKTVSPIRAICILHQDSVNHVGELSATEAFPLLLQRIYTPENPTLIIKTLRLFHAITKAGIRFYDIGCNMEPDAAELAYRAIYNANY